MIACQSPFRITLGGGGTDLPLFYKNYGSRFTSMAIDKYIYVFFKRNLLEKKIRLQYLKTEFVQKAQDLSHQRAKESLLKFSLLTGCEISSMAELPARSGLGSSGAYLCALIKCLSDSTKKNLSTYEIAEAACEIEIDKLKSGAGKQDPFISAYGGLRKFSIDRKGNVKNEALNLSDRSLQEFIDRCPIYYTQIQRDASLCLKAQTENPKAFLEKMKTVQELGDKLTLSLEEERFDDYGKLLGEYWTYKNHLSPTMSTTKSTNAYNQLKERGLILGGKLIGAGGGGFLTVYTPNSVKKIDKLMKSWGFSKINYGISHHGTTTLLKA